LVGQRIEQLEQLPEVGLCSARDADRHCASVHAAEHDEHIVEGNQHSERHRIVGARLDALRLARG
jgi:hypothetical protein